MRGKHDAVPGTQGVRYLPHAIGFNHPQKGRAHPTAATHGSSGSTTGVLDGEVPEGRPGFVPVRRAGRAYFGDDFDMISEGDSVVGNATEKVVPWPGLLVMWR